MPDFDSSQVTLDEFREVAADIFAATGEDMPEITEAAMRKALEEAADELDQYGRWVTIGGHAEGDKKHVGGFAAEIDEEGRILKANGPKELVGKKVSEVGDHFKGKENSASPPVDKPAASSTIGDSGGKAPAETQQAKQEGGKMETQTHQAARAKIAAGKKCKLTIGGNTKAVKESLKAKGWRWDPDAQNWYQWLVPAHAQRVIDANGVHAADPGLFDGIGGHKKGCEMQLEGERLWASKTYGGASYAGGSYNPDPEGFNRDSRGYHVPTKQIPGSAPDDRI